MIINLTATYQFDNKRGIKELISGKAHPNNIKNSARGSCFTGRGDGVLYGNLADGGAREELSQMRQSEMPTKDNGK